MDMTEAKETKDFKKVDKITKIITITISLLLGSIFLAACVYMLSMINEEQKNNKSVDYSNNVQNMNLVSM